MTTFYKFTNEGGKSYNGFQWDLPKKRKDGTWKPGKWAVKIKGELEACENGYHFTSPEWVAGWIDAEMYEIEIDGDFITANDSTPYKNVCRRARLVRRIETWDEKTARLFAVSCARDALKLIKNLDPRSVNAVDVAERFANGKATKVELDAAGDAAGDAAFDAATKKFSKRLLKMVGE